MWRDWRGVARATAQGATGFGLLLLATLWTFGHMHVESRRTLTLEAAERNTSDLTRALTEHVARSVKEIDATLLFLRQAKAQQGESFKLTDYTDSGYFKKDLLLQVAYVDADGVLVDSNLAAPSERVDLSDREHVRVHMTRTADELFISKPVLGRVSGKWSIQFSRRILGPGGSHAGVLVASVNPDSFSEYYASFDLGEGAIAIVGADGVLRVSSIQSAEEYMTKPFPDFAKLRAVGDRGGCVSHTDQIRRVSKLMCVRRIPDSDIYVVVWKPLSDIVKDVDSLESAATLLNMFLTALALPLMGGSIAKRYRLSQALDGRERARRRADGIARDLRCALDNMSHGIMLLDSEGAVLVSNDQAYALMGLGGLGAQTPADNDRLRACVEALAVAAVPGLHALRDALGLEKTFMRCAGPDGRVLKVRTGPLADGGFVRTVEDITDRHENERLMASARDVAQEASRARALFLARMSHELRTPLHAVVGFVRLLRHEKLDPEPVRLAGMIDEASTHLISIVDDILDFSAADAGRLRLSPTPVDLEALLGRFQSIASVLLADKPVVFRAALAPDAPRWILCDERRLAQIMMNLIGNAAKFTRSGEIVVDLSGFQGEDGARRLRIVVRDTGVGVLPELLGDLFHPFSRGEGASQMSGAGLGLAIVHDLVARMGGHIAVSSDPGRGATFVATILAPPVEAAPQASRAEAAEPAAAARSLDVLVADDTRSSQLLIGMLLKKRGHRVVAVDDGLEAVKAARRQAFDLVLLDIQMPVMDGLEAARAIRADNAGKDRRPLISALTAQVLPHDHDAARAAGMDAVLKKPFRESELDAVLRRAAHGDVELA